MFRHFLQIFLSLMVVYSTAEAAGLSQLVCHRIFRTTGFRTGDDVVLVSFNAAKAKKKFDQGTFDTLVEKADIVLLQEATPGFLRDSFIYEVFTQAWSWLSMQTGLATFSKVRASSQRKIRAPGREFWVGTPKMSTYDTFPIVDTNKDLLVINTHALNFRFSKAFRRQIDQVLEVIRRHKGPLVWGGDFNTWGVKRKAYLDAKLKELDISEGVIPHRVEHIFYLDHIFYRGVHVVDKVQVNIDISDHRPLLFHFRI